MRIIFPHPIRTPKVSQKLYRFQCLPILFCLDPQEFAKLLKYPLAHLKLQQVHVSGFNDDLFVLSRSFVKLNGVLNLL